MLKKIGIWGLCPPEHIAHVLNLCSLILSLKRIGISDIVLFCSNVKIPFTKYYWNEGIKDMPEIRLLNIDNCEINNINVYEGKNINSFSKIFIPFIKSFDLDFLWIDTYSKYWYQIVNCSIKANIIPILHVRISHTNPKLESILNQKTNEWKALKMSPILTVSDNAIKIFLEETFKINKPIIVLPKVVEPIFTTQADQKRFVSFDLANILNESEIVLGYFGRLVEYKNIGFFIKNIWPRVTKLSLKKITFLVIGDGFDSDILKFFKGHNNFYFYNHIITHIETLKLLNKINGLVFPSGRECGPPRLPMEALCMGTNLFLANSFFNSVYIGHSNIFELNRRNSGISSEGPMFFYPNKKSILSCFPKFIDDINNNKPSKQYYRKIFSPNNLDKSISKLISLF